MDKAVGGVKGVQEPRDSLVSVEMQVMELKLCVLLIFYIGGWRDFKELRPAVEVLWLVRFLPRGSPQVSSRDIVAGLFSNSQGSSFTAENWVAGDGDEAVERIPLNQGAGAGVSSVHQSLTGSSAEHTQRHYHLHR